jgi:type I restriction enzyme S subunit
MGQSPKGDSYNEDGLGTVFFQGRAEFGWRFPTVRLYTTSPQRMAKKGDILMSVRAPVGDINIAAEDCCIGRGLAAIRSEYPTFTLYAIKEQQDQLDIFNGEGTVFGSITKDGLSSLSIPMPDKKRIQEFEDRFSILDEKIKENSNQILTLQKLRDTLLPKLISGEVRVKI